MGTIDFFLCAMFTISCNDAWKELQLKYPSNTEHEFKKLEKVTIYDHEKRKGAIANIRGAVDETGIFLQASRRSKVSVHIPWTSVDACAQTLWCPERDTNLWIDEMNIEITFADTNRVILWQCEEHQPLVLTPKVYRSVKYGKIPLSSVTENDELDLFAMGCSETSYY